VVAAEIQEGGGGGGGGESSRGCEAGGGNEPWEWVGGGIYRGGRAMAARQPANMGFGFHGGKEAFLREAVVCIVDMVKWIVIRLCIYTVIYIIKHTE
jgi:hypothetical protein